MDFFPCSIIHSLFGFFLYIPIYLTHIYLVNLPIPSPIHIYMIHQYVYLLDSFRSLYPQLPQKWLPKGDLMCALVEQNVKNQSNTEDISVKNVMLAYP